MATENVSARRRFARMVSICGLFLLSAAFAAMPVAADKHGSGGSGKGSGDKVEMNNNPGANQAKVDDDVNDDANEHQGMVDNDANEHQGAAVHDAKDDDADAENEPKDDDDAATPIMMPLTAPAG